jgi:FkbM family methyltransferase
MEGRNMSEVKREKIDAFVSRNFKESRFFSKFCLDMLTTSRSLSDDRDKDSLFEFLIFALPYSKMSQSQLMQDLWALWESNEKKAGYFVEFGASDGITLSNTYLLEKHFGWRGIVAEPDPRSLGKLREVRNCYVSDKCVFSVSDLDVDFIPAPNPALSRMYDIVPDDTHEQKGKRLPAAQSDICKVKTISLNQLLSDAGAPSFIDFISIDTEGSEMEILSAFDFSKWRFGAICVEHNHTPMREEIFDLLVKNGYRRKWEDFSKFDNWYVPVE